MKFSKETVDFTKPIMTAAGFQAELKFHFANWWVCLVTLPSGSKLVYQVDKYGNPIGRNDDRIINSPEAKPLTQEAAAHLTKVKDKKTGDILTVSRVTDKGVWLPCRVDPSSYLTFYQVEFGKVVLSVDCEVSFQELMDNFTTMDGKALCLTY